LSPSSIHIRTAIASAGVRGVVDETDVRTGKVKIIAPVGFMDHAVAENVYAGNAMTRRMFYQYGVLLPRSPYGHVDQSIGKNTAAGNTGLIPPTVIVAKDFEDMTVDGVRMVFQNTPGTEAPAEMNTYFPDLKAFWAAENITAVINRYLGYWDANPATLIPLSPQDSAPLYVEMMGGSAKIMVKGKELSDEGKYYLAQEVLNKLVYAEPQNQPAKDLLADVFEQIV
jgi:alkyl sulfatase BDS1-like metallo-beta-lactamase superfamily hydrolase